MSDAQSQSVMLAEQISNRIELLIDELNTKRSLDREDIVSLMLALSLVQLKSNTIIIANEQAGNDAHERAVTAAYFER